MPATIAIGRPGTDEYAPYYAGYIQQITGDDALPVLVAQLDQMEPLLRGITEERGLLRYAPGKWSVKEVLNHLSDSERVFAYRALRFARADATPLPSFDENAWVPASGSDRRPIAEIVSELSAVRAASRALFQSLGEEAIARRGDASGKPISVRALAWIIAGHTQHHAAILRDRYGLRG
jgi:DinB family protein